MYFSFSFAFLSLLFILSLYFSLYLSITYLLYSNIYSLLSSLFIRGFRGYDESGFTLSGHTAIVGTNGSGKTHILEALHIVSGGHFSYVQAPREREKMISFEVTYQTEIGNKSYSLTRHEGKDVYMIQGKKVT